MKKLIAGSAVAASAIACLGLALPASASGSPVAGNYVVADNGQGCWAGGALLADGSGTGAGGCSFSGPAGQEVLRFTTRSWTGDATAGVTLCVNAIATKDPAGIFPTGQFAFGCLGPVPVNIGPVKINGTLIKISLR